LPGLLKKWSWRAIGFAVWFLFLRGAFGWFASVPFCGWTEAFFCREFALYRLLLYISALFLFLIINRWTKAGFWTSLKFAGYVIFFPLMLAVILAATAFKSLSLSAASAARLWTAYASPYFLAVSAVFWPLCGIFIVYAHNSIYTRIAMFLLALTASRLLLGLVRAALAPLKIFDGLLADFFYAFRAGRHEESAMELAALPPAAFGLKMATLRRELATLEWQKNLLDGYMESRTRPNLPVGVFLVIFSALFMLIWATFSFEMLGILKFRPDCFGGNPAGIFDCLYASLMWLATSCPDGFAVHTRAARLIVGFETLAGLGLFGMLLSVFAIVVNRHVQDGGELFAPARSSIEEAIRLRREMIESASRER
jgi:hypothetical protein